VFSAARALKCASFNWLKAISWKVCCCLYEKKFVIHIAERSVEAFFCCGSPRSFENFLLDNIRRYKNSMGMTNSTPNGYHGGSAAEYGSDSSVPERNGSMAGGVYTNGGIAHTSCSDIDEEQYDLICIGFGPASLAIAIALHEQSQPARVLFLERQPEFAWHSGMLLPGTRMQISFIKDLATLRNPRSEFTFVNYLHCKKRLVSFTNLGTFLPLREEYNDYMSWCAAHFEDVVRYAQDVISVSPVFSIPDNGDDAKPVKRWEVLSKCTVTGKPSIRRAKNVVIAVGGRPAFPPSIAPDLPHRRIIHSSRYSDSVPELLDDPSKQYRIAVVGAGQSSAEIFNDLHFRYPASKTSLYIRQHALKPSDDSPFVNEIFNPDRVDTLYSLTPEVRAASIREDSATNYSVVRLPLIENLYDTLYHQRMRDPDENNWQHRIHALQEVVGMEWDQDDKVRLKLRNTRTGELVGSGDDAFDAVIFGTGYSRDVHHTMLKPVKSLMKDGCCSVGRDYRVVFREGAVAEDAAIFLQGCCEATHGVGSLRLRVENERANGAFLVER
jgi:L-ornithine N5-oxygenase